MTRTQRLGAFGADGRNPQVGAAALLGREGVVEETKALLAAGRSVLVVGPAGCGKTALIGRVWQAGVLVVDPFAGLTTPRAAALRRALDRGAVVLGAARSIDRRAMGHVGRIAWRFQRVYLRPLGARDIRHLVRSTLDAEGAAGLAPDERWMAEATEVAAGLPGRAVSLAGVTAARWRREATLLPPRMALAIAWQDGLENAPEVACHAAGDRRASVVGLRSMATAR